jgi:streptogramin lyase
MKRDAPFALALIGLSTEGEPNMFKISHSKGTVRKLQPSKRRVTPWVELLEDRCLPAIAIAEFPVLTAGASPLGITTGPDGNVWFTENQADHIGMINPTTHAVSEFAIPTAASGPSGITAGPDGNVWFTEFAANQIGMMNLSTHVISQFPIPTAGSGPSGITAGPDGNLWFTEFNAGQIAEINPGTHVVTEFPLPTAASGPMGITAGPDGNIWFTESAGNNIGTISPTMHTINESPIPQSGSQPFEIAAGSNGSMFFTENATNGIGEINVSTFAIAKANIPTGSSGPYGITSGADGNIWFTESSASKIGELGISNGVMGETDVPTAGATEITAGPGGTLWFTEASGNQIGELVASPTVTTDPASMKIVEGQSTTFRASATGFPTPSVHWQVSSNGGATYTPLVNAGVYSGVNTDTLTITGATPMMNGFDFEAVFSNGIGFTPTANTTPAVLTVKTLLNITPALPQGIVGASYDQTLTVVGSFTPIDVLTVSNFNPGATGLTPGAITTNTGNGTIVISGTPSAAGNATFTVTVANTTGNTLTQNLTITIRPPLSIATALLPPATAGAAYSQTITVVGGVLPFTTFNVTGFSAGGTGLIAGDITANATTGVFNVVGTPSAGGTATFTINVTDSAGTVVTQDYSITVNPALSITPSLPAGTSGTLYNQTLTVIGGGVPYTSLTVSGLNAGKTGLTSANITTSATAATVTINGTPTAAGTLTFTVNVVDAIGAVLNKTYTVTINQGLAITPSLPQGTVGTTYQHTLTVIGGATPYTITPSPFSAGGTGLIAADININAMLGTIIISGTPTATGTASFSVTVTDAAGSSLTQAYSITINAAPTIGSLSVSQWTAGQTGFTGVLTVSGGTGPFSITAAGLPTGLTAVLSGATIGFSGKPTAAGAFTSGSVTLHDAAGAVASKTFSITIHAAPVVGSLTATQWTLGMTGFKGVMAVGGGTGGLSLVSSTGLPAGLNLALAGNTISFTGTPTTAATYSGSVTLHDAIGAAVTKTFTITINATPIIGSLTTTVWTAAKSGFTGALAIAGGTGPFVLSSVSGLPTGLSAVVSGSTVSITGTPTVAQTFASGTITVRDAAGASVTRAFSISINPPLQITTTRFAASTMAVMYTAAVQAKGGTGAVTFAITAGSLPPGMKLGKNGVITGVSRGFGSFTFTITATDAIGATVSEKFKLSLAF